MRTIDLNVTRVAPFTNINPVTRRPPNLLCHHRRHIWHYQQTHIATCHDGRERVMKHPSFKRMATLQLELCLVCPENRKRPKTTGVVERPLLSRQFNSRSQVHLIDMQSAPQGQFRWIMVYQC